MTDNTETGWRSVVLKQGRVRPTLRALLLLPALVGLGLPLLFVFLVALGSLGIPSAMGLGAPPGGPGGPHGGTGAFVAQIALLALYLLVVLAGTFLLRRFLDGRSLTSLGFQRARRWLGEILFGLGLGLGLMSLIFALAWSMGWLRVDGLRWEGEPWQLIASRLAYDVVTFIVVGISEETMTRGYILQNLEEDWGMPAAAVGSSVIFGLLHAGNPSVTALALFNLFVAGLLFAYAFAVTRRLWLPIAFHFSWNFFQGPVFGFPVSGTIEQSVLVTQTSGPSLLTGGGFGPEGGLIGLGAELLGFAIVWGWSRMPCASAF